jgi:hypothetical protein
MIETEVWTCPNGPPIFQDKMGNEYTYGGSQFESLIESIDLELQAHGLELLVGDCGSSDYFFCIVKKGESDGLRD